MIANSSSVFLCLFFSCNIGDVCHLHHRRLPQLSDRITTAFLLFQCLLVLCKGIQGCGNPMPDLSDLLRVPSGQANFLSLVVRGQVHYKEKTIISKYWTSKNLFRATNFFVFTCPRTSA